MRKAAPDDPSPTPGPYVKDKETGLEELAPEKSAENSKSED